MTKTPSRGTNPLDKFGRRTKCAICGSVFHWVKDCPHKDDKTANVKLTEQSVGIDKVTEECNITLLSWESKTDNEIFVAESLGCAVIDTACTRTVCGQKWLDSYMETLSDDLKS